MKSPLRFLDRWQRPVLFAVLIGLMVGLVAWSLLPRKPRTVVSGVFDRVLLAPDGSSYFTLHVPASLTDEGIVWPAGTEIKLCDSALGSVRFSAIVQPGFLQREFIAYSADSRKVAVLSVVYDTDHLGGEDARLEQFFHSGKVIRVWECDTGNEVQSVASQDWDPIRNMHAVFFSPDGTILALSRKYIDGIGSYEIWDVNRREILSSGKEPWWSDDPVEMARFHTFAIELDGNTDAMFSAPMTITSAIPPSYALNRDGSTLLRVAYDQETPIVWTNGSRRELPFPDARVQPQPAMAPDGQFIAISAHYAKEANGYLDQVLHWLGIPEPAHDDLWLLETSTGHPLAHFPRPERVSFSPQGETMILVYKDRTEFWDIPLRRPWWMIVAIALGGFAIVLAIALGRFIVSRSLRSAKR